MALGIFWGRIAVDIDELLRTEGGILIVDDLGTARKVLHRHLNRLAFTNVHEACDAVSGMEILNTKDVKLVISDWSMPKISGIEFLKQIRSDARFKHLPFILITANSAKEVVIEAANFGVSDFLAKPFSPETLQARIKNALNYESRRAQKNESDQKSEGSAN